MAQDYVKVTIDSSEEWLLGLLWTTYSFESFEEQESSIIGYMPSIVFDDERDAISELLASHDISWTSEVLPPTNWNAEWEKNFTPIEVGDICYVRADFHPAKPGFQHTILINPKMAFGTGHHETTYMMMERMARLQLSNSAVFDYGCGTGILAVLASLMGARHIDAIDIEEESYKNTLENCDINSITNVSAYEATLDSFDAKVYDVILANINRNVLMNSADELYRRLAPGGTILLSGILKVDEPLIQSVYSNAGFRLQDVHQRGDWLCIQLMK